MADETLDLLALLWRHRVIAEVQSPRRESLLGWAVAAAQGGLHFLALPASVPDVAVIAAELSDLDLTMGISGVVSTDHVAIAIAAGAHYVISPICDPEIVQQCRQHGLAVFAGASTPTEVYRASRQTPDLVLIYPAGTLGGPPYLRMLWEQFPDLPLCATGGVDVDAAPAYLEAGASAIVIDKGLFPQESDADSAMVISARTKALMEVCNELGLSAAPAA